MKYTATTRDITMQVSSDNITKTPGTIFWGLKRDSKLNWENVLKSSSQEMQCYVYFIMLEFSCLHILKLRPR